MFLVHPRVLAELVERYECLTAAGTAPDEERARRVEDTVYTLCVATGTRDIADALGVARARLQETPATDSPLSPMDVVNSPGRPTRRETLALG
jgi:hypothetical protein